MNRMRLKTKIKIFLAILSLLTASVSLYASVIKLNSEGSIVKGYSDIGSGFNTAGFGSSIEENGKNRPPEIPVKPSGPTFIEMGVEYIYMSATFDYDGDQIRYRFDWGDSTISDWTDFTSSNMSVSMSHIWNAISNYNVRVIAQDINGINSSWSLVLNVMVSQADFEGMPSFVVNCDNIFHNNIWNSNGNHWDATGSNIQLAIWDLNSTDGGMVWVGSDVNLSNPIRLRDNVILDFQKNQVTLTADIEFVNVTVTKYSVVKNVKVKVTDEHTASIIKLYTSPDGDWSDRVRYNIFENIYIKNPSRWIPNVGWSEHNYTGIHLELGESNFLYNTFRDIQMEGVGVGIRLEAGKNVTSFGNGNLFENIWIAQYVTAVLFDVDSSAKWGFNQNVFFHVKAQSAKFSKYGVYNISGNGNHFEHCLMWDWWVAENPACRWSINSDAWKTYICAHLISDIHDEGKDTTIV